MPRQAYINKYIILQGFYTIIIYDIIYDLYNKSLFSEIHIRNINIFCT
jgi:hypothetical protein